MADAFCYRNQIYCWTYANELLVFDVDEVSRTLRRDHGEIGLAAAYAFFSSRGIGATPDQRDAWHKVLDSESRPDSIYTLKLDVEPKTRIGTGAEFYSCLDMLVYYDRLYVASEAGMYTFDTTLLRDFAPSRHGINGDLESRVS